MMVRRIQIGKDVITMRYSMKGGKVTNLECFVLPVAMYQKQIKRL